MSNGELKQVLQDHINNQRSHSSQLKKLRQMEKPSVNSNNKNPYWLSSSWVASFVASFLVIGLFYYFNPGNQATQYEQIGDEVAGNHIKLRPLEIKTNDMKVIRQYFTELDFSPVESILLDDGATTLLGGRYCSIQGVSAAQLRLKEKTTGQIQSLYQTIYDTKTFNDLPKLEEGELPITVYSKGLEIDLWVEKGVLFAITRQSDHKK